jgi:hypothetical protein
MMKNRRSVVAMLGLVPAGSALAVENFTTGPEPGERVRSVSNAYQKERFVQALKNLAAEVESGRFDVESINVHAHLGADEIADKHSVEITFLHRADMA